MGQSRRTKMSTTTLPDEAWSGFTVRPLRSTAPCCAAESAEATRSKNGSARDRGAVLKPETALLGDLKKKRRRNMGTASPDIVRQKFDRKTGLTVEKARSKCQFALQFGLGVFNCRKNVLAAFISGLNSSTRRALDRASPSRPARQNVRARFIPAPLLPGARSKAPRNKLTAEERFPFCASMTPRFVAASIRSGSNARARW